MGGRRASGRLTSRAWGHSVLSLPPTAPSRAVTAVESGRRGTSVWTTRASVVRVTSLARHERRLGRLPATRRSVRAIGRLRQRRLLGSLVMDRDAVRARGRRGISIIGRARTCDGGGGFGRCRRAVRRRIGRWRVERNRRRRAVGTRCCGVGSSVRCHRGHALSGVGVAWSIRIAVGRDARATWAVVHGRGATRSRGATVVRWRP